MLIFLLALAFIVYVFAKLISKNYASSNRDYLVHHYYAWWYPIYNVFSSKTIGVDFNSIYGFYPYIAVAFKNHRWRNTGEYVFNDCNCLVCYEF